MISRHIASAKSRRHIASANSRRHNFSANSRRHFSHCRIVGLILSTVVVHFSFSLFALQKVRKMQFILLLVLSAVSVGLFQQVDSSTKNPYNKYAGDSGAYGPLEEMEIVKGNNTLCARKLVDEALPSMNGGQRVSCSYYSGCSSCANYCGKSGYPYYCCDGTWCCCYLYSSPCSASPYCPYNGCWEVAWHMRDWDVFFLSINFLGFSLNFEKYSVVFLCETFFFLSFLSQTTSFSTTKRASRNFLPHSWRQGNTNKPLLSSCHHFLLALSLFCLFAVEHVHHRLVERPQISLHTLGMRCCSLDCLLFIPMRQSFEEYDGVICYEYPRCVCVCVFYTFDSGRK